MITAMELHDTFVSSVERNEDGSGDLRLWAVVHRFEGELNTGFHDSGWQNIRLHFTDFVIDGESGDGDDYIAEGFLAVNGVEDHGLLSFPVEHRGEVLLSIVVSVNDEFPTVTIRGSGLSICAEGEFKLEYVWNAPKAADAGSA
jgi:hypothetical protein